MTYSLTWLAQVLAAAGLKVAEQPGWTTRGLGDVGPTKGVLCHHTAGPLTGDMPSLGVVTNGRTGQNPLRGPLAQLCLGRDGAFYVVAAGFANHAGPGNWKGVTTGNTNFIGIEAENTGLADDPWPAAQMDAYGRGVAAILKHIGLDQTWWRPQGIRPAAGPGNRSVVRHRTISRPGRRHPRRRELSARHDPRGGRPGPADDPGARRRRFGSPAAAGDRHSGGRPVRARHEAYCDFGPAGLVPDGIAGPKHTVYPGLSASVARP